MASRLNLIKSKSSNSAITKSGLRESTRSNLQVQKHSIKKRGVYVENKATKTVSPETNTKQERPIPPPLPRKSSKRFLPSVLTILSKGTASTQYPDHVGKKSTHNNKQKLLTSKLDTAKNTNNHNAQNKKKYKSRVLKKGGIDKIEEQVIILQPEEMAHSSSIFSVKGSPIRQSLVQQYIDKRRAKNIEMDKRYDHNANNSLVKEILEGKQLNNDKTVRINDLTTGVGVSNEKTDDKGLYNFFVDLLETINQQDAKTDLTSNPSSPTITLEIDKSVAKKLNVKCISPTFSASRSPSPKSHSFCLKDSDKSKPMQNTFRKTVIKRPIKSQSFSYPPKPQIKIEKRAIYTAPRKLKAESYAAPIKLSKKKRKENLLNMFKAQLKIDDNGFEEPQSLYEALKIIADNKRKCQKTIHFNEKLRTQRKDSDYPECVFKRPLVFGGKRKKNVKTANDLPKKHEARSYMKSIKNNSYATDVSGSQLSLKVVGYEYENERPKPKIKRPVKEVVLTYHSSPSLSDQGFDSVDDNFEYTDAYFNSISRAPVHGF